MVIFGKIGCNRGKVVVFGQKCLYSGKSGFILTKNVVFGLNGSFRAKVVLFEQIWLYSG